MVNQEKMLVYKQHQELELIRANLTCTKCKEPVNKSDQQQQQQQLFSLQKQQQNTLVHATNGSLLASKTAS